MADYSKLELIGRQIVVGITSGVLAGLIFSSFSFYFNNENSLFSDMLFASVGACIGMLFGVNISGFVYLKMSITSKKFLYSISKCFLGLMISIAVVGVMTGYGGKLLNIEKSETLLTAMSVIVTFMPLILIIAAFNFRLSQLINIKQ